MSDASPLLAALRQSADPQAVEALEHLVAHGTDRELNRINALAFAGACGLDEEKVIAALLHAARLGIFEMSWNLLCPGCSGVLDTSSTLKTVDQDLYHCALCAAGYEPTLDEMVEVTFTVSPRVRRIAADDSNSLPPTEYYRQVFWGSCIALPEDLAEDIARIMLEILDIASSERAL